MIGKFLPLLLLLSIDCFSASAVSSQNDQVVHHGHHDLQHHRKHSKHPKHPHSIIDNTSRDFQELWKAYQIFLNRLSRSLAKDDNDGLPWWYNIIPHFPWPSFPFPWPPMLPPPPPPPPPLCPPPSPPVNFTSSDVDRINLALNIHYLQAEFFLHAAFGHGLDKVNAKLAKKGPPPLGGRKAQLSTRMEHVAKELGLQSTGHIRAIHDKLDKQSICRPLLNISVGVWDSLISKALIHNHTEVDGGGSLHFDPYENDANFLIAAYVIPYIGLNTLVDSSNRVTGIQARKLVSGLMGVQAGQDAVIRTLLFEIMENKLPPYNVTVAKLTSLVSDLRHKLDHTRKADEGLSVHQNRGAEKQVNGNLISANDYSMAISRSPQQVLQVLYGTGDASVPGLFFPKGANGKIAGIFLKPRRPKI